MPFDTRRLRPELAEGLALAGYVDMTPIQAAALPAMLRGEDVIGQAKTGSGKTAAFGLALLNRVDPGQATTQALALCPTRELADQVAGELRKLARRMPHLRVVTACGGRPLRGQRAALERGPQVVVGTPGRVLKHLRRGALALSGLRGLVLDEADRLLDMGFADQVLDVVGRCPPDRQTLLFSATWPEGVAALSEAVQRAPRFVGVEALVAPDTLRQRVYVCAPGARNQLVVNLLVAHRPASVLLFCETRAVCDRLAAFLRARGASALALHGGMEQQRRDDALLQFANGSACALVATDVAARGLDIPALPLVIITELSPDPEVHVHRVGRTGRAGEAGLALSVAAGPAELARLERVEALLGPIERGMPPAESGGLGFMTPAKRTLLILSGRRDKLRRGDVLGALVKDAGVPAEAIGRIDLMERSCAVAIDQAHAERARARVRRIKKRRVRVRLLG